MKKIPILCLFWMYSIPILAQTEICPQVFSTFGSYQTLQDGNDITFTAGEPFLLLSKTKILF